METYFDYLRAMAPKLGARIVETYPALPSPKDEPAARLKSLLRSPLPAQALAITGLREAKFQETFTAGKTGTTRFSPLWQADGSKIQRMAPLDFIGRYMKGWWDYAIADELHQLAGDTAQGNGLGVLARCAEKLIALTGTLMGIRRLLSTVVRCGG